MIVELELTEQEIKLMIDTLKRDMLVVAGDIRNRNLMQRTVGIEPGFYKYLDDVNSKDKIRFDDLGKLKSKLVDILYRT